MERRDDAGRSAEDALGDRRRRAVAWQLHNRHFRRHQRHDGVDHDLAGHDGLDLIEASAAATAFSLLREPSTMR
jgi:hypothetical protein